MTFVDLAIDVPLRTLFTYLVPKEHEHNLKRGHFVRVSFGKKNVVGLCLKLHKSSPKDSVLSKIKAIDENLSLKGSHPTLSENYLSWLEFASQYYLAPMGQVVAQAIPPFYFDLKKLGKDKAPQSRAQIFSESFVQKNISLTDEQTKILDQLEHNLHQFYPALLHGITGSGKTEIYIRLMQKALANNKSALFLVPEIGLTPQMLARLNHHFAGKLVVYHSSLTSNQRLNHWKSCLDPEPKIMVGTRSALFAPFPNLGVIIIDEEHDNSYKQDDRFRYHARDLAIKRAHLENIPVILGSATPSLESYFLALEKKYHYFELKNRFGEAQLPEIRIVDFGKEREQTGSHVLVSQNIHQAIDHFYDKRRQMMIFVGQRGFAQNAFCQPCAKIQLCPNCSVGLKYHKPGHHLKCHYCAFEKIFDEICLYCTKKTLNLLGFGTQSIEEEIKTLHPTVLVRRIDSDTATTLNQISEIFESFAKQEFNLLIGTQMISKGHDFHNVGFVGVLGIDAHLGLPEFRASERAFQNFVQVAGRAGRADNKGHVIVQSLMPTHNSIQFGAKQDFHGFAAEELKARKELNYPPYSRLVQIRFLSNHEKTLTNFFRQWQGFLDNLQRKTNPLDLQILGPAEMPIAKVRGKHRHHIIFKIRRGIKATDIMEFVLNDLEARKLKDLQYQIDVDAISLV